MTVHTDTVSVSPVGHGDVRVTGRRIVATVIDLMVISAAYNVLLELFGDFRYPRAWGRPLQTEPANVIFAIGVLLYFVSMEAYLGRTLGKIVAGIVIVRVDATGRPGLRAASIRTAMRLLDGLFFYGIALVAVLSSPERQRLGDRMAGTLVVRDRVGRSPVAALRDKSPATSSIAGMRGAS